MNNKLSNPVNLIIIILLALVVTYFAFGKSSETKDIYDQPIKGSEEVEINDEVTMSFFVTSKNPGNGANFGGIDGADAHCQQLAGTFQKWNAYLSTTGPEAQNARDRIGNGPWYNANGVLIAQDIDDLHSDNNNITKETALDENGNTINGRGDQPNKHDILTGSSDQGTPAGTETDTTCNNWTSESSDGSAIVGHSDRQGLDDSEAAKSWNSSHGSRGCSLENLQATGGEGLLYCFQVN